MNRRKWQRYEVNWPFQIEGVDRDGKVFWTDGYLRDISARGSSGHCFCPPDAGTRIVISIRIPFKGEQWMRYLAEIVRVEQDEPGTFIALKFESSHPIFYSRDLKKGDAAEAPASGTAQIKKASYGTVVYKTETVS